MEQRYFYVFEGQRGQPVFHLYYRDRPTKYALGTMGRLLHERMLSPGQHDWSLTELAVEYGMLGPPAPTLVPLHDETLPPPTLLD